MKHYIKSTILALVVLAVVMPINQVFAVVQQTNSSVNLTSSNFTSTNDIGQENGSIYRLFTLKYKLKAINGDVYIPTSCASDVAANQTGTIYKLNSANKSVFDSSCSLSVKNLVAQRQGSWSFYKIKKGETKDFTLEVKVKNVRSTESVKTSVSVVSINWGTALNTRNPQTSTPNKHNPANFDSESFFVATVTKIPLSIEFQTNKTVNYRDKFDFSWIAKGSLLSRCVTTGDKVKVEQAPGGMILHFINIMLPVQSFWTNLDQIPASGKAKLEARDAYKADYVNSLTVGLDCYNVFGEKVSSSTVITVQNPSIVPKIQSINGSAPTETYLNNKSATITASDTGVTLGTYSTGTVKKCSLAITNSNGEGSTVSLPDVPVTSMLASRRVNLPTGNTSGYYKVTFSCFNNQDTKVDDIVYLKINNGQEIYNVQVTGFSKNPSTPNVWGRNIKKRVTWSTKNFSAGDKVDILLCNDSVEVQPKCWPMKEKVPYKAEGLTVGRTEYLPIYSGDKTNSNQYYIKIRKVNNQSIVGVTDFKFTAGDLTPPLRQAPNSGSIPAPTTVPSTRVVPDVVGVPTTWGHKETKEIRWNKDKIVNKDGTISAKVDILLCNDTPAIKKCWPQNVSIDNDGDQSVSMWGADKYTNAEYYLKIRKVGGGGTELMSSKFTAGSLTQSAVDDRSNLASVLLSLQEMLNKLIGLVR